MMSATFYDGLMTGTLLAVTPEENDLTRSAYLNVLSEFSQHLSEGEQHAIMTVFDSFMKESLKISVSLLSLNFLCGLSISIALIHSLSASKLVFISAPSILVCLSVFYTSPALSAPAKSINDILPCVLRFGDFSAIYKIA